MPFSFDRFHLSNPEEKSQALKAQIGVLEAASPTAAVTVLLSASGAGRGDVGMALVRLMCQ